MPGHYKIPELAREVGLLFAHMPGKDAQRGDDRNGEKDSGDSTQLLTRKQSKNHQHRVNADTAALDAA